MTIAKTRTTKRKVQNGTIDQVGFVMPELPAMPAPPAQGEYLSTDEQHALGYRIMISQIGMMTAMCAHTDVVEMLLDDVQEVLNSETPVGQALAMIKVGSQWVRADSIPTAQFKAIAQGKLDSIRASLAEVSSFRDGNSDLFTMSLRAELATKMAEVLPYDKILFKAADFFRDRCKGLDVASRNLVSFVGAELKLPRPKVKAIVGQGWISPGLFATLSTSVYELSLFPPKAKKSLRDAVLSHQKSIKQIVVEASSTAGDLMAAWSSFNAQDRILKSSVSMMYEFNRKLVESMVMQYRHAGDVDQIRSAGDMGLLRAIYRFAPEMGFRFSTIGTQWIKQMIIRELQQQSLIRLPEGSQASLFAIRAVLAEHPNASAVTIAEITRLSAFEVENLMFFVGGTGGLSLDSAYVPSGASEAEGLHEVIECENTDLVGDVEEDNSKAFIERVLGEVLADRHLEVLRSQFGLGSVEENLKECGERLGMSLERVRQVRLEAIAKLKKSKYYDDLLELWA